MAKNTLNELFDIESLLEGLKSHPNRLILVPNRRLLAKINSAWRAYCASQNIVRPALRVFAINDFLHAQYLSLVSCFRLPVLKVLSANEERFVWRKILTQSKEQLPMLKLSATAEMCITANNALHQWLLDDFNVENENHQFFKDWRQSFNDYCLAHAFIARGKLESMVVASFEPTQQDQKALFVGFDSLNPLYKQLASKLCAERLIKEPLCSHQEVLSFADEMQEIEAAITFAKSELEKNPQARIALVDPMLSHRRDKIYQALAKSFANESFSTFYARKVLPINISAGSAILDAPIINILLSLANLWSRDMDLSALRNLCYSPFIRAADDEFCVRQSFYFDIRKLNRPSHSSAFIRSKLQNSCPVLYSCFEKASQQSRTFASNNAQLTLEQWLDYLNELTEICGWPGQRETDSIEFQQLEHWYRLRQEILQQSLVVGPLTYSEFISFLRDSLQNSIFQAQVDDSAIQVLGGLEAAYLNFDSMWILSMDDSQFPSRPSASPLLPLDLQIKLDMPHSSALRELDFAKSQLASWRASAKRLIFSFARVSGDIKQRISPLLADMTQDQVPALLNTREQSLAIFEQFEDIYAPSLDTQNVIAGGASLLSAQAECPFKAFGRYRLGIQQIDPVSHAISASDRGTAMHRALEVLLPVGTKQAHLLHKKANNVLLDDLQNAVSQAINYLYKQRPDVMTTALVGIEKTRIFNVLSAFIDVELERSDFEVVAVEHTVETNFYGLRLRLRIDRIDKLEHDLCIVIDYKTGKADIAGWQGERPTDPQLLLYCLHYADNVNALAKASIANKNLQYKGLSSNDLGIQGVKAITFDEFTEPAAIWKHQIQIWNERLGILAQEFISGLAKVDPINSAACQYCHLKDVCRIGERQ